MAYELASCNHVYDTAAHDVCPFCDQPNKPSAAGPTISQCPVGWVVAVEGPASGRDFRLRMGENWIGRGGDAELSVDSDSHSRSADFSCLFVDESDNRFEFRPGATSEPCYVNDQVAAASVPLTAGARIRLGETLLVVVPLVGDRFRWSAQ